jgi:hypothetical protein
MMARRIVMIACLVAGIGVLAGVGWALLAAGVLAEVAWPREQPVWLPAVERRARAAVAAAWAAPRRAVAAVLMAAGMVAVPVGVLLAAGFGVSLVVAGALAGGVSLLVGWNA